MMSTSAETITGIDQFAGISEDIEEIVFANGSMLDPGGILNRVEDDLVLYADGGGWYIG